jgi:hypothetical protein
MDPPVSGKRNLTMKNATKKTEKPRVPTRATLTRATAPGIPDTTSGNRSFLWPSAELRARNPTLEELESLLCQALKLGGSDTRSFQPVPENTCL